MARHPRNMTGSNGKDGKHKSPLFNLDDKYDWCSLYGPEKTDMLRNCRETTCPAPPPDATEHAYNNGRQI